MASSVCYLLDRVVSSFSSNSQQESKEAYLLRCLTFPSQGPCYVEFSCKRTKVLFVLSVAHQKASCVACGVTSSVKTCKANFFLKRFRTSIEYNPLWGYPSYSRVFTERLSLSEEAPDTITCYKVTNPTIETWSIVLLKVKNSRGNLFKFKQFVAFIKIIS